MRGDGQHQEIVSPLDSPLAHFGNGLATVPIGRKRAGVNRAAAAARHFGLLAEPSSCIGSPPFKCQKEKRVSKDLIHDFFGSPLT